MISGSVRTGTPLLASTTGAAPPGLIVTVVGTAISSGVDAAGRFTLTGVPAGDVLLKFTGPGIDYTLGLSPVLPSQTVTLAIHVDGGAVVVESEVRSTSGEQELEGRVESLPPTTPSGELTVAGRTVKTNADTRVEQGGAAKTFADLQIGMRVHVKGTTSGPDVLASVIRIQNTVTWVPVQVNGVIDTLSGTASLFQFKIGSRVVKGDDLSVFFGGGSSPASFGSLEDGVRVEVRGQQRDGYVYAERLHVHIRDEDEEAEEDEQAGSQEASASIHGVLTAIGGSTPSLTLTVGGTTVLTSSSTVVRRRGDVQPLDALKTGQTLHVVGTRRSDAALDARLILIDDDAVGGEFEMDGQVGGLAGSCPAVTFGVNGFTIRTGSATVFLGGTCVSLRNGDSASVTGTKQADGSILATAVKR